MQFRRQNGFHIVCPLTCEEINPLDNCYERKNPDEYPIYYKKKCVHYIKSSISCDHFIRILECSHEDFEKVNSKEV